MCAETDAADVPSPLSLSVGRWLSTHRHRRTSGMCSLESQCGMASHNTSSELTGFSCFAVRWEQLSKMVGRYCKRHGTRISVGLLIQELHSKTGNR